MPGKPNPERNKKIRELWNCGKYTQRFIGELYGIPQSHVSRIVRHMCLARAEPPKALKRIQVTWNGQKKTVLK